VLLQYQRPEQLQQRLLDMVVPLLLFVEVLNADKPNGRVSK